ncbi:MAG: toxin-antitoxin system YwqK family antitoxin [Bacteroidales bacterium]|jgi:antitoxin component YwqK of YwqJK toxin-antitoxin module|nr:toxin-antitoxin system YwqK family antitoxin [Bacteroidales bacterium]
MNRILISILFFTVFSVGLTAQNVGKMEGDTLTNYIDINNKKQGKWIKRYDNGQIRYKGAFINDIPVGVFYYYFPNGKTKSVLNYDDQGNANAEIYWENGNIYAKGFYNIKQERNNEWHIFYEDGTPAVILNYDNGEINGFMVMYYPGGKSKLMETNYKNGKLEGDYKRYFEGNKVLEEGPCVNGVRHGYWKFYNLGGVVEEEGMYVNGKREGDWIIYNKDTNKKETVGYKNDFPDNYQEMMEELREKQEWAKQNQDKFKHPEDYIDDPIEFFMDRK